MSFTKRLVEDSLPIWQDCLNSEFLQRMADGSLDPECLKGYIVDDSLYLREYAKVFAWGMTKAEDMDAIRSYYSLLSFVNEGEGATRLHYLPHFGLSAPDLPHLPLRPTTVPAPPLAHGGQGVVSMCCPRSRSQLPT